MKYTLYCQGCGWTTQFGRKTTDDETAEFHAIMHLDSNECSKAIVVVKENSTSRVFEVHLE